jgi:hypothetical protein
VQIKMKKTAASMPPASGLRPGPDETLWEHFHRRDIDLWRAQTADQTRHRVRSFEVFTLASDRKRPRARRRAGGRPRIAAERRPSPCARAWNSGRTMR